MSNLQSIYRRFNLRNGNGAPIDLLKTMDITFDEAEKKGVALWEETYCDRWFEYNAPQMQLTCEGIVGRYNIRFLASIIGNDAATPLRPSDGFDIWKGEIPRMGHKFLMSAEKMRKLLSIAEDPRMKDVQKFNEIKKAFVKDYQDAYLGTKDSVDHIILRAISNYGVANFTAAINPDGRTYKVDYNMPTENRMKAALPWTEANIQNLQIMKDMEAMRKIIDDKNLDFEEGELLMTSDLKQFLKTIPALKLAILGHDKSASVVTEAQFDAYWKDQCKFPTITIVKKKNRIQKDGKPEKINPWNEGMITWKPAGNIGEIQPAYEDNEIIEEQSVDYTNAGNGIRIAKWRVGESSGQKAGEYTQGSWRAIPIITSINAIVGMKVIY